MALLGFFIGIAHFLMSYPAYETGCQWFVLYVISGLNDYSPQLKHSSAEFLRIGGKFVGKLEKYVL